MNRPAIPLDAQQAARDVDVRSRLFLINRVPGMRPVHYGDPFSPMCCIPGVEKPWSTSWFMDDVTCKRCRTVLGLKP